MKLIIVSTLLTTLLLTSSSIVPSPEAEVVTPSVPLIEPMENDIIEGTEYVLSCFESGRFCDNICCYARFKGHPMCENGCLEDDDFPVDDDQELDLELAELGVRVVGSVANIWNSVSAF